MNKNKLKQQDMFYKIYYTAKAFLNKNLIYKFVYLFLHKSERS